MNKGELKAAVLDTLVRQDLSGKPVVDTWVAAATTRLNEDLLLNDQLALATSPATGKNVNLPGDFIAMKSIRLLGSDLTRTGSVLQYMPPEEISGISRNPENSRCSPKFYTTFGKRIELSPFGGPGNYTLEMWYYREFPQLVDDTDTNFALEKYPQLYINLTCSMGHQYLLEADAAMAREAVAMTEIQRLMGRKETEKYGDGPLLIRPSRRIGGRFS